MKKKYNQVQEKRSSATQLGVRDTSFDIFANRMAGTYWFICGVEGLADNPTAQSLSAG